MERPSASARPRSLRGVYGGLFAALLLLILLALLVGRVTITLSDLSMMGRAYLKGVPLSDSLQIKQTILLHLRLPRLLMALFAGMGMAAAGVVFQASLRNLLVSPEILGVSAGSSLGALLALSLLSSASLIWIAPSAFIGGIIAVLFCMSIARRMRGDSVVNMILIGLVLTSLLNALLFLLKYRLDPYQKLPSILFWLFGSLSHAGWIELGAVAVGCGTISLLFFKMRFHLNLVSLDDLESHALGFSARHVRTRFLFLASAMVAIIVACCGQIGWIALVVPHAARAWVGPDHLRMVPVSLLLGAVTLLGADLLSYQFTTVELPISVVTSLIGAPLFVGLLYRQRGSGWV